VSSRTFRTICALAFASLCTIVLTGALVRLTGSGLGCADWPRCNETRFVDVSSGHTAIEQLNRLFTGVVSAAVIGAVLVAHARTPRRRDLIALAWGLVVGVLAQVLIGGIVVLTGLHPLVNMAHFLVSMVLVALAFALVRRSGDVHSGPWWRPLPPDLLVPVSVLAALAIGVIVAGTVVTASGPHAGDENAPRLGLALESTARVHGGLVVALVAVLVLVLVRARRAGEASLLDAVHLVVGATLVQAGIGYLQYFTDVPVVLVAVHIAGATFFWCTVVALVTRPPETVAIVRP
jgi:cytochrome c oxidase assembly protein subunit 15